MTYNPQSLRDLGTYWTKNGGVNLGVVGNTAHTKGYHLGKDRIYDGSGPGLGDRDYSVQTTRDKKGLTDAASAIDLGRLNGSYVQLRTFSKWLVSQARKNAAGTSMMREIIYSPDGKTVLRWDRQRGYASAPRTGEADSSHLTHTHISFYRDTEKKDKRPIFAPYFTPVPPKPPEDPSMPTLTSYVPGHIAVLKATSNVRTSPEIQGTTNLIRTVPAGKTETWEVTGWVKGGVDPESGSDKWICRWYGNRWEYTAESNIPGGVVEPTDSTPYSKADLDAAVAASAKTNYNAALDAATKAVAGIPRK
jgi:hypothetical protein